MIRGMGSNKQIGMASNSPFSLLWFFMALKPRDIGAAAHRHLDFAPSTTEFRGALRRFPGEIIL